jgi:hypothetical protein
MIPSRCIRNCGGRSTLEPFRTTTFNSMAAKDSIESCYFRSISADFNKSPKLVRDQGVGGSNPLSPTNIINNVQTFSSRLKIQCRRFCSGESLQVPQSAVKSKCPVETAHLGGRLATRTGRVSRTGATASWIRSLSSVDGRQARRCQAPEELIQAKSWRLSQITEAIPSAPSTQ